MSAVATPSGGVVLRLTGDDVELLTAWVGELARLVAPDRTEPADPIAAMVGLDATRDRPDDPALQRLFPDGYREDEAASADFRRYTEHDLRQAKAQRAEVVLESLSGRSGATELVLDAEQSRAWLGSLNDLRLVLGTRLGITDEEAAEEWPDDDDPRAPAMVAYHWLTYLQGTLVEAMSPRHP